MFSSLELTNFTSFAQLDWPDHSAMNVIIGENDTGKTHLLKMLYSVGRSINLYFQKKDGPQPRPWMDCFIHKLSWTMQPKKNDYFYLLHDNKKGMEIISCVGNGRLSFVMPDVSKIEIDPLGVPKPLPIIHMFDGINPIGPVVFFPPKEILTAMHAIEATRRRMEIAGFDDTYLDLIDDFRIAPTYGEIGINLKEILTKIRKTLNDGEIDEEDHHFVYRREGETYSMSLTAEGFKKIGVLSRLILNRSLTQGSVLLVDEPEVNLHPQAIIALADILFALSQAGIQVYAATHSYFFLKRIEQLARLTKTKTSLVDLRKSPTGVTATFHDLRDEMPDNPILTQSEYLLNEDIRLDWGE
ncbi:MAG: ATP-binding protein [Nitrospirae bacterium]|nr:ATP-binding protein [Magnetococcales bacterium]